MTIIKHDQSTDKHLYWVADNIIATDFPPVEKALRDPDGLLAIGGDLSTTTLLNAYSKGIFPWYSQGQPILWWSPNPRCVMETSDLKISRSLNKVIRKNKFRVSFNRAFKKVIQACADARSGREETWITKEMNDAYINLHEMDYAISVETWDEEGNLVGGLYGVALGKVFFGESMFSVVSDASKIAMVHLVNTLVEKEFRLIDCQVHSKHLQSLGAKPIERDLFSRTLKHYCDLETLHQWSTSKIVL
jgi:leucyl/phenylalanyl-tRNA--protein transferase